MQRALPFLLTGIIVCVAGLYPFSLPHPAFTIAGLAVATAAALAVTTVSWETWPRMLTVLPMFGSPIAIGLLLAGEGAVDVGLVALLLLPILWSALYGRPWETGAVVALGVAGILLVAWFYGDIESTTIVQPVICWAPIAGMIAWAVHGFRRRLAADLAAQARADATLRDREELFEAVVENIGDLVSVVHPDGTTAYVSGAFPEVTGFTSLDDIPGSGWETVVESDLPAVQQAFAEVLAQPGARGRATYRVRHPDGSVHWIETTARNAIDSPGIRGVVATSRNVDSQKRSELLVRSQTRILRMVAAGNPLRETLDAIATEVRQLLPGSRCAVQVIGPDRRFAVAGLVAPEGLPCMQMEGRRADPKSSVCAACAVRGQELVIADPADDPSWRSAPCLRVQPVGTCWATPIRNQDGHQFVGVVSCVFPDHFRPDPTARSVVESAAELASIAIARKRFEDELSHRASHDSLTDLPNRSGLLELVEEMLINRLRTQRSGAVVLVDLDHFKRVNDSLGHHVGNRVLQQVAVRLSEQVPHGVTVARLGSDEFGILCPDIADETAAGALVERLLDAVNLPLVVRGQELRLTASAGVALLSREKLSAETLMRRVESAMFRAKERGRDRWAVFDAGMRAKPAKSLQLVSALRRAVEADVLEVWYQPIWSLLRRRTVGVEALVRWRVGDGALIPPSEFVPLAEESGLIGRIGAHVLLQAAQDLRVLDAVRPESRLVMSVNASGRQLADGSLVPAVRDALEAGAVAPDRLLVELTESALLTDVHVAEESVSGLKRLGVNVVLDDFGTGYSSLSLVTRFPGITAIKIDRSFVVPCCQPQAIERSVIRACLALADAQGAHVTAEGVETAEQLGALRTLGVDQVQGYLIARPMPLDELRSWLVDEAWGGVGYSSGVVELTGT